MKIPNTKLKNNLWLILLISFAAVTGVKGQTIAYWRFEDGNFAADSSGNGHTLSNSGAIVETTSLPPTFAGGSNTGAASFGGAALMQTLASLDLTPYTQVTLEWFMQADTSAAAFVWTHTPFIFPGGVAAAINYIGGANGIDIRAALDPNDAGALATITAPIPGGTDPGVWQHFALYVDTENLNNYQLLINGVVASVLHTSTGTGTPLANSLFYIGGTGGSPAYTGLIDEFRISQGLLNPDQFLDVVPEPSAYSLMLVSVGAIFLIKRRRLFSK